MKKVKLTKVMASMLVVSSVLLLNNVEAKADFIQNDNGKIWYREGDSWATGWKYIKGNWHYFGQDGYAKKGWLQDTNSNWYYLYWDGLMATNTTIDGCYVDKNGVWIPNYNTQNVITLDKNIEKEIRNLLNKQTGKLSSDDLLKITELNLYNKEVSSLEGVDKLLNLTKLNLKNNNISDISPLSKLTKLKYLEIGNFTHGRNYYNSIKDIKPLKSLTNLETLSLSGLRLTNVDDIANLTNLKELQMYSTLFSWDREEASIEPLKKLTNLEILNLSKSNLKDIAALKNLKNLKKLTLSQNKISDVTALKNLKNLEELDLTINSKLNLNSITILEKNIPNCNIKH